MKLRTFIDRPILACVISALILLAKTAILVTEYAATRRRQGMTVLTMVIGMLPLVFASGAGANGNVSLGTGVDSRHHRPALRGALAVYRLPGDRGAGDAPASA